MRPGMSELLAGGGHDRLHDDVFTDILGDGADADGEATQARGRLRSGGLGKTFKVDGESGREAFRAWPGANRPEPVRRDFLDKAAVRRGLMVQVRR